MHLACPHSSKRLIDTPTGRTDIKIFGKETLQTAYHNRPSVESTDLDVTLKSRTCVISCLAGLPSHLHLLHHDPRLAYSLFSGTHLVLRDVVCGKKRRRICSRRRRPDTRQRFSEGHRNPSGITTLPDCGLRRRSSLWGLASWRPPVPSRPQRHFVIIIREVNDMRRSYKKNPIDRNYKKSSVD